MEPKQRPSFLSSVNAGMVGFIKGALAVGITAAVVGAGAGAILGALAMGGVASGGGMLGAAIGAGVVGLKLGTIGAIIGASIGAYTGVLQSREANAPDAQDIINVANISFAQGVEVGHHQQAAQQSIEQAREAKNHFQEQLAAGRANASQHKGV